MLRKAVVSGLFYPSQPELLNKNLVDYLGPPLSIMHRGQ